MEPTETEYKFDFNEFKRKWPSPVVARSQSGKFTGGGVSPKTLANEDSLGTGPEGRFLIGGHVVYPVDSFIRWLQRRSATGKRKNR